jgi:hypothetical protein
MVIPARQSRFVCAVLFVLLGIHTTFAQKLNSEAEWNAAKKAGQLNGMKWNSIRVNNRTQVNYKTGSSTPSIQAATNSCHCWQARDSSWQIAPMNGSGGNGGPGLPPFYRNDDWTTPEIFLPFSFCLYGKSWDSVYINTNGNVSFGGPYSVFTAVTFPNTQFVMVAPFWGDVDTRDSTKSGLIYFKITPTHMIVQWDHVGYFDTHSDLLNTFQLILTNGSDPLVPRRKCCLLLSGYAVDHG